MTLGKTEVPEEPVTVVTNIVDLEIPKNLEKAKEALNGLRKFIHYLRVDNRFMKVPSVKEFLEKRKLDTSSEEETQRILPKQLSLITSQEIFNWKRDFESFVREGFSATLVDVAPETIELKVQKTLSWRNSCLSPLEKFLQGDE